MSFFSLFCCEPPTFQQKHLIFPGHLTIQQVYPVSLPTKTEVLTDEGLFVLFQFIYLVIITNPSIRKDRWNLFPHFVSPH